MLGSVAQESSRLAEQVLKKRPFGDNSADTSGQLSAVHGPSLAMNTDDASDLASCADEIVPSNDSASQPPKSMRAIINSQ